MSKINKIKVNGTPYEVEDKEAVKTVTLTQAEYDALQTKDPSIFYVISDGQGGGGGMTSGEVQTMIDSSISGKADSSGVTQEISAATSGKVDTTTFNTYSGAVDTALSGKQETLVSGTNIKTINGNSVLGSGNITISGGGSGSSAVEVTQAEYDALVSGGTLDPSVLYIITDAVGGDLSNYMTSAQTMNAISAATSTKQDILSAGTGIDITDNTISVTGGGITSGEVQDMIDESISGKVDTTTFNTYSGAVDTTLSGKQDTLSAGTNITITDNVISAQLEGGTVSRGDVEDMIEQATSGLQETLIAGSGITISGNVISADAQEITVDPSLDSGSTNAVANSAITNAIDGKQNAAAGGYFTSKEVTIGFVNSSSYQKGYGSFMFNNSNGGLTERLKDLFFISTINGKTLMGSNQYFLNSFNLVETSDITSAITSASTNSQVPSAKAVYDAISAGGGGGGLDDDTQLLLSTALTDLNDRKADLSEVKQNYQRKGDYATKSELAAKANVSDVMTLEKAKENEQVTSYALNNLNNRVTDNTTALGGMKLVKLTQSEYTALTTKDENTLYVVIADPE